MRIFDLTGNIPFPLTVHERRLIIETAIVVEQNEVFSIE